MKGVYFSSNDKVFDWTLGFLRSFRQYNPDLSLYLIPFNEDSKKVFELSEEFNFQIYSDSSFIELEELGQAYELGFSPYGRFWFRRYAAFWGPLDHFMYLDARQLVLDDLTPAINLISNEDLDFVYYDLALDQVYEPGELRNSFMKNKSGRGFNSGRWVSKKGVFTKSELLELGYNSLKKREQLNPRNTDQAFINYCVDSKPGLKTGHWAEWLGGTIHQSWAGQRGRIYKKDKHFFLWDYGGLDHKKKVMILHWAGYNWTDPLPQSHILNKFSPPTVSVRIKRFLNYLKRLVKSSYFLRKRLGHV